MSYLGSIRLLGDSPASEDVDQNLPQNDLQSAWNEKGRHYEEKSGEIEMAGHKYQFRVSFIKLKYRDSRDRSFSHELPRALTEVAPNFDEPHDIVVPVLPGWGETSAQFEGDFLEILLDVLKEAGYENPKIIGINPAGRGTPEYLDEKNGNRISGVGMMDEIYDVQNIADALAGRGYFYKPGTNPAVKPKVAVIGHSMGALNSSAFMNIMNHKGGELGNGRKNEDLKVERLLHMMPAVDGPFAMVRARFLWAVRKQVIESVKQAVPGKGALSLNEEDYHRIMFGDKDFRDPEQYARSVPDSARRFLQLTLNLRRRFANVYRAGGPADGVKMTVWKGGKDKLIPDNAIKDLPRLVDANGLKDRVNVELLSDLSHSIPFRLRDVQKDQVKAALGRFLNS
jgi:alpha-beta hydrolase superfamily lysophospholipase